MLRTEDDSEALRKACYAAYDESVRTAFRTLSSLITEYFDEHPELYVAGRLEVPRTFRPLKEYERTLKIQELALRLALRTVNSPDGNLADNAGRQVGAIGQSDQFLPQQSHIS